MHYVPKVSLRSTVATELREILHAPSRPQSETLLRTMVAKYRASAQELAAGAETVGYPCFVKPVMSSSGKGQSFVESPDEIADAWTYAQDSGRVAGAAASMAANGRAMTNQGRPSCMVGRDKTPRAGASDTEARSHPARSADQR